MADTAKGFWDAATQSWNSGDYLGAFGNALGAGFTPFGTGDNAMSIGQIGLSAIGILNQRKAQQQQLEEARRQFEFSKGNTRSNFLTQGANFANQGLFQLEGLNAFNPQAGAERAGNFGAAMDTMNAAGSQIGLGDRAFGAQQDALAKYSTLKPNVGG